MKNVTIKPSSGGMLMSGVSSDTAGIFNYTTKRDFRRWLDREIRSEGYDRFNPKPEFPPVMPETNDEITLIANVQSPNGHRAVVAGTKTTLWRYYGFDDRYYVLDPYSVGDGWHLAGTFDLSVDPETGAAEETYGDYTPGALQARDPADTDQLYVDDDYVSDSAASWQVIGSGFSAQGERWESVNINGSLILNNGVDLPVSYRERDIQVKPLGELADLGVVSVGTIAAHNGILVCMDIRQEKPNGEPGVDKYQWRMLWSAPDEPTRFGAIVTGTVTPTSDVIELDEPTTSFSIGQSVTVVSPEGTGTGSITGTIVYTTPTQLWLGDGAIINAGKALRDAAEQAERNVESALLSLQTSQSALVAARASLDVAIADLAENPADPDLIKAKADAESLADYASSQVDSSQEVYDKAVSARDKALEALEPMKVEVQSADALDSVAGKFEDLIDDGSAILRGLTLRNYFIIYKETCVFIARYTGQVDQPFVFERAPIPMSAALKFKHTLVDVGGMFHFYCASNGFFRFDLTNRIPMEIAEMSPCRELFFSRATVAAEPFSAENLATREVFVCIPGSASADATIRFDYAHNTVSTTSMTMTAAATVAKPTDPSNNRLSDLWFVMGGPDGELRRYGFVDGPDVNSGEITATVSGGVVTASAGVFTADHVGRSIRFSGGLTFAISEFVSTTEVNVVGDSELAEPETFRIVNAIWHRDGAGYRSVMQSGMESFCSPHSEKMLSGYVLLLSSWSGSTNIDIAIRSGVNTSGVADEAQTTIDQPLSNNLVPTAVQAFYLGDRIEVDGVNNPVEISGRIMQVDGVDSRSFSRHP